MKWYCKIHYHLLVYPDSGDIYFIIHTAYLYFNKDDNINHRNKKFQKVKYCHTAWKKNLVEFVKRNVTISYDKTKYNIFEMLAIRFAKFSTNAIIGNVKKKENFIYFVEEQGWQHP